ncbi:NTP transferase domain-containing protein [Streptomyces longwoodensis]|uniref:nucleotidyltransferase family protein n=1 Tax=Streptomyces longwoodensis TaxID=68231 RepID=UPI0033B757E1
MRADGNHDAACIVVLTGGRGARLGRLTDEIPKPLIEVGGQPILWHVFACYKAAGVTRALSPRATGPNRSHNCSLRTLPWKSSTPGSRRTPAAEFSDLPTG